MKVAFVFSGVIRDLNRTTKIFQNKIEEFNADVANPNTPTKAEDLQQDLKITVASLSVFGKTK